MKTARRWLALLLTLALAAVALPGCLGLPGDTSQIALVSSVTINGWQYDYYRNNAYDCAISGHPTFVVGRKAGSLDTQSVPLWVVMHGDGVGWFDSSGNPQPDGTQMTEESAATLRGHLMTGDLLNAVRTDGLSQSFRLLAVSYCDRDRYGGTGGPDPNNPHLVAGTRHKTNGMQATKAAIQFVEAKYPTSKYFLHGLGDGASGAYVAAYPLQKMGNAPAGVIGDSGVENIYAGRAAYQQGVCTNARYGPSGAPIVAQRVDESVADSNNEVDQLVSRGELTVPLLHMWNRNDPSTCGNTPMQCPMRDGSVQTLGATDCTHRRLADAINASRLKIPSQNMPLCVTQTCGLRPLTTGFGLINTDVASPTNFLAAVMDWVDGRLADVPAPPDTPKVASGAAHTCVVVDGGKIKCWGTNGFGQLGNGTTTSSATPVEVVGISGAIGVAAGRYHTCALLDGGAVHCWGDLSVVTGEFHDCEDVCPVPPQRAGPGLGVGALAAGGGHTCAETLGGALNCWGLNTSGELGLGFSGLFEGGFVSGVSAPTAVTAGESHTCVALAGGAAKCWGLNNVGQLGDGTTTLSSSPVSVAGLAGAVTGIDAGYAHTCAVLAGGTVECWGNNAAGQLGDGSTTSSSTPVAVSGVTGVTRIGAGKSHTCAIVAGGGVQCWGANDRAQLGDGSTTPSPTAVSVVGVSGVSALDAGDEHNCVPVSAGGVTCWGSDQSGQLGNGISDFSASFPVPVSSVSNVISLSAGQGHTCVVIDDGSVQCWGDNFRGQLGDGTTVQTSTPVAVSGISDATSVSAGGWSTCAVVTGGAVKCWGYNVQGQLGNGTTTNSNVPVSVSGLTGAVAVANGSLHTCALIADGSVECWGSNFFGSLGNGTTVSSTTPVTVSGITTATAVGVGDGSACALLADESVECWGRGGTLGNGTTADSSTPVAVTGLSGVTALDTGGAHSCAVIGGGAVKCWGLNFQGELGNGTTTTATTPVSVAGLAGATSVALGSNHSCALVAGGAMSCWGDNSSGQLGDQTFADRTTPVSVTGLSGAASISASELAQGPLIGHTCALAPDGSLECWGSNLQGQLAMPTPLLFLTPVDVIGL